jgi:UDPglucose--hexose-1-phosphate uridylyltransferase
MGAVGTEPTQAGGGRLAWKNGRLAWKGGQLAWKNSACLADGREIIFSGEAPRLNRALARDMRHGRASAPTPSTWRPEQAVRWDPLLGEWVVIAARRQDRTFLPPPDRCPLDPSAPGRPAEVPADSYDVVVLRAASPLCAGQARCRAPKPGIGPVRC